MTTEVSENVSRRRNTLGTVACRVGLMGLIVGGVFAAWVAGTLGISTAAASQIVSYAPFEFSGLIVAGAAGVYPLICAVLGRNSRNGDHVVRRYMNSLPATLLLLVASTILIMMGAIFESFVIE